MSYDSKMWWHHVLRAGVAVAGLIAFLTWAVVAGAFYGAPHWCIAASIVAAFCAFAVFVEMADANHHRNRADELDRSRYRLPDDIRL